MVSLPKDVTIKEVGPRDGLQNEKTLIDTDAKIDLINRLSESGLSYIELTSFVHPKWIPQLKDAVEVAKGIDRKDDVTYAALVPNLKGLERAIDADVDEVSIFMSASETHNQKNINKSIDETYPVLQEVVNGAKQEGKSVRGYISTVFGCPYEGQIDVNQVMSVCDNLFSMGIDELSIGDTIGVANPIQVHNVLSSMKERFDQDHLALHFHDTRGMALANTYVALDHGFRTFDGSLGGLGGCPYAKGASGNVATDDLVHMLTEMGIETGVNLDKLTDAGLAIEKHLDKSLPSKQMELVRRM
ncbi:hydroxymethylglutaryl-CoA lyase [Alkalibacillus almallahensis]|uniref:hydroxymethylglutaryl-CoA lyase n=1 Tax=Alkalibacillus almallahensis TaxID=1379154 RepID=UPI00141DE9EE|nr:hydroxymethylglutaryl-CoA lyase [Alkalibacillus almallahensis]NIK10984.1 hydroxymethylglutaryl-CoA lyase [Alkalibacillus almallahensis]